MDKKKYMYPTMEVVNLKYQPQLLADSEPQKYGDEFGYVPNQMSDKNQLA